MITMPMLENVPEKPAPMTLAMPLTVLPSASVVLTSGIPGDQAEYQRNGHDREERMDLQLADAEDHQCDGKNEDNDQSNASHRCFLPVFLFLWVFVGRFPCTQYSSAARKIHIEKQQIFSDFLLKITKRFLHIKSRDTC